MEYSALFRRLFAQGRFIMIHMPVGLTGIVRSDKGRLKVRVVASDNRPDLYQSSMTLPLFRSFIEHQKEREDNVLFDVSHYEAGVVGEVDQLYMDGERLKAVGYVGGSPMAERLKARLLDPEGRKRTGCSISFDPLDFY